MTAFHKTDINYEFLTNPTNQKTGLTRKVGYDWLQITSYFRKYIFQNAKMMIKIAKFNQLCGEAPPKPQQMQL